MELGTPTQDFRVGYQASLGDPLLQMGEILPEDQIGILLREVRLLTRRVEDLEASQFKARARRAGVWVHRHGVRLAEGLRTGLRRAWRRFLEH